VQMTIAAAVLGQGDDRVVEVGVQDEGFQIVEFLFRSDGRYQIDTRSTDPEFGYAMTERGRDEVRGQELQVISYEFSGEAQGVRYEDQLAGDSLTLIRSEFSISDVYQFKPGSRGLS
jgi:hypothetical protein